MYNVGKENRQDSQTEYSHFEYAALAREMRAF
jgi:hypothetical protein